MAGRRGRETVRDMVLSLGLVGLFVAVIVAITLRPSPDPVRVVDPAPVVSVLPQLAPYPVLRPGPLPGWRATSVRASPPGAVPWEWHVGYVTPAGEYASVGQSNGEPGRYLQVEGAAGAASGSSTIRGQRWSKVERDGDGDGTRSLVRTAGGVTTLVSGTASYAELVQLAGSLRPAQASATASPRPSAASRR